MALGYRDHQRPADIQAAIDAIRSHLQRGDLPRGLIFDTVRIRLLEIGEAVRRYRTTCWPRNHRSRAGRCPYARPPRPPVLRYRGASRVRSCLTVRRGCPPNDHVCRACEDDRHGSGRPLVAGRLYQEDVERDVVGVAQAVEDLSGRRRRPAR